MALILTGCSKNNRTVISENKNVDNTKLTLLTSFEALEKTLSDEMFDIIFEKFPNNILFV